VSADGSEPGPETEGWFTERLQDAAGYALRIKQRLHSEQTPYQRLELFEAPLHGKVLTLDGYVMLTELDEFIYHEMLAHVGLQTLPEARRALVIGGGDGGLATEMLKYPELRVTQVEIDERVVRVSQEHLPQVSRGLSDPRVELLFRDGVAYLDETPEGTFDLIAVDSTDPIGAAEGLITEAFYARAARALSEDGVFVAQTQCPFYNPDEMRRLYANLRAVFPRVWAYWAVCPSYLGALWTFCYASRTRHPLEDMRSRGLEGMGLRYYTPEVHRGAFALPPFVSDLVGGAAET
jgi:spermidine synthase